ncbi:MAG: NYN domain-containing protein [Oceanospirillaceae bacterium]|nr:NYN domain-containing protein [Oceanospirillaceae bacterium]
MHKTAIFVDVQNIYYTTKAIYNRSFDYRKFWRDCSKNHDIVNATAYAIDSNDTGQQKFQAALRHIGFNVKLKPYIQRADGSAKGDWDVGITIDIMEQAPVVDKIILLSGDGDFSILLEHVAKHKNVITQVHSVTKLTAKTLMDCTDTHREILMADLI